MLPFFVLATLYSNKSFNYKAIPPLLIQLLYSKQSFTFICILKVPIVYIIAVWEVQYGRSFGKIADSANEAELVDDSAESFFILLVFDELGMRLRNKHLISPIWGM